MPSPNQSQLTTFHPDALRALHERKASVMTRRPGFARGSGHTRVRMEAGYVCDVEHEDRSMRADQPASEGGGGTGPHPGQLMRASLAACLAMGYRTWGARLRTAIEAVEVEITCDYDARGQMGLDDEIAIGWQRILFVVRIDSSADEAAVRKVVEIADRLSPMLANLAPGIERRHALTVRRLSASATNREG